MSYRLTALDAAFLDLERTGGPMHVGSVMVFEPRDEPLSPDRLIDHIRSRLAYVPRYRQRLHPIPGRLANPVWCDDPDFNFDNHIRRSAIPTPGSADQLNDLVARVMPRQLDRSRPLWEVYVVDGLRDNRLALISKTHPALVDGKRSVDLLQAVLDSSPANPLAPVDTWHPQAPPSKAGLLVGAARELLRKPSEIVEMVRKPSAPTSARASARQVSDALRSARRVGPIPPLNPPRVGSHRRYTTYACDLPTLRAIRDRARPVEDDESGLRRVTINDVVLAVLAGGLRHWLLARQWPVRAGSVVRALVPVTVQLAPEERRVFDDSAMKVHWVDLPVGEPNPMVRLHRIAYQLAAHSNSDQAVPASRLSDAGGFIAPTIQALGLRATYRLSHRLFNIAIVNVPGPQRPMYAAGLAMTDIFPVLPVIANQALAIGVTSYRGQVAFGFHGDRDSMRDLGRFVSCVNDSVDELSSMA